MNNKYIITDIDIVQVHNEHNFNYYRFPTTKELFSNYDPTMNYSNNYINQEIQTAETIVLYDEHGNKSTLGMTKEVEEKLGIYIKTFSEQQQIIFKLKKDNDTIHNMYFDSKNEVYDLYIELGKFNGMNFWQRLKFLFKGKQ